MSVTRAELESFRRFVDGQLNSDSADELELEDYLQRWRADCERDETIAEILEAVAEIDDGQGSSLEEVDARIREHLLRRQESA
ncbi:MAG: hypothetical protein ACK5Q5_19180 [Planctomycetaceae bacterium]